MALLRWPLFILVLAESMKITYGQVLNPPYFNLAEAKKVTVTSTCGEQNGQPIRELYCSLAGATRYSPYDGYYSYNYEDDLVSLRVPGEGAAPLENRKPLLHGGQNCEYCDAANPELNHPAEYMVDGTPRYWQSPPLSRGMDYNKVNITIDLEQEFHVAYVSMQMANSPRPGLWVLERSIDYGKSYLPWQYFAETPAQCEEFFGPDSLQPIMDDDSVICTTEYSQIIPLGNGQIFVTLLNNRPGRGNFSHSDKLQRFTRATNVRIRLLRTKTLQGHLMDLNDKKDPTITRRYFYSIKEIEMGGRCVCNGHAQTCDILDPLRPTRLLCRCEHNTCGDQCEQCCPGFEQKRWHPVREGQVFECEPCNCFGHSTECEYDAEVDANQKSLDIHGQYKGGGVCKNCRHNTTGINCESCSSGFFRPAGRQPDSIEACIPCRCDSPFFNGSCDPETGRCHCAKQFQSPKCDACSYGYYGFPECKECACFLPGSQGDVCLPRDGQCPCKNNFNGKHCNSCSDGHYNFPSCTACTCNQPGSVDNVCNKTTGDCYCKMNYNGTVCERCANGYFNYPNCTFCKCNAAGALPEICDNTTGACLCKPTHAGKSCDKCSDGYYDLSECKACHCSSDGSFSTSCNVQTGQCQCKPNYTGRKCDRCAAGYYGFPRCLACDCNRYGSLGTTCTDEGQCFCKSSFTGLKCDSCKENLFNYPLCEECNCDLRGVSLDFAGCDKVPEGDLCSCKSQVTGRRCQQCKPFHWNLQYHNLQGCEPCNCYLPGTLSSLTDCNHVSGQCICKLNVIGRDCSQCKDGFYALNASNPFGCQPCECDIGGSYSHMCEPRTGQCHCKPRVGGRRCSDPLEAHFFPTLQHISYEAEDGLNSDYKSVRYASNEEVFPKFSGRGFVPFSPIQDEINIPFDIPQSSVYLVLINYQNPTEGDVNVKFRVEPYFSRDKEGTQEMEVRLPPVASGPASTLLKTSSGQPHPFVLNPGRWLLKVKTADRFFLDNVAFLPESYVVGSTLHDNFPKPCHQSDLKKHPCELLVYPDLSSYVTLRRSDFRVVADNSTTPMQPYPTMLQDSSDENSGWINSDDVYVLQIGDVPPGNYTILINYQNFEPEVVPAEARLSGDPFSSGSIVFEHCPYSTFCREVVVSQGKPWNVPIKQQGAQIHIQPKAKANIALKDVTLMPSEEWDPAYLLPKSKCVVTDVGCLGYSFLPIPESTTIEVESGYRNLSVTGRDSDIEVHDPNIILLPLSNFQGMLHFTGRVPRPDRYVFIFHYYNPSHAHLPMTMHIRNIEDGNFQSVGESSNDVLLPVEPFSSDYALPENANAIMDLRFCPSISGCRTIVHSNDDKRSAAFDIVDKFDLSVFQNNVSGDTAYFDYLLVVPLSGYSDDLLVPHSVERLQPSLENCSQHLSEPLLHLETIDDECKKRIFSLTVDFNVGAMSCDCDLEGSTSFVCKPYGGQCQCKQNIIGRKCDQCRSGFFGFPDCRPCNCAMNRMCDPITGSCYCPPLTEGNRCDRCKLHAYGFDPFIGCQECHCNAVGTIGQSLNCDQTNGQCSCMNNVGGRRCEKCLAGFYGYPHCYECACDLSGSNADICDQNSAACLCKENVAGSTCATCAPGTFNLASDNEKGCTQCFCFGITDHCRSSTFKKTSITDMYGWKVPSWVEKYKLKETDGQVEVIFEESDAISKEGKLLYLSSPISYLGNRLLSYGGKIEYMIAVVPREGASMITASPDLIMRGKNMSIEYWSESQPSSFESYFSVQATLLPEKWTQENGEAVTRGQMLMVLQNVTALLFKVSYFSNTKHAMLKEVSMDSADENDFAEGELAASHVEVCHCPPPYKGSSCEECADGFYRVGSGSLLGSCVPCRCHGHSKSCDQLTGQCFDCKHNTTGHNCELCERGFYGDATFGTSRDCQVCPCPHPTVENNFALDCTVSERGNLLACHCKEGYTGERCERCATGWYGDPYRPGNKCQRCFCNDNNDLSIENACDPQSGRCLFCMNNTDGFHCDVCSPWFYGDAKEEKNCTECSCDQCGAKKCDSQTGKCSCKDNVEGENCERCAKNAWGFHHCQGCQTCNCAAASISGQCDPETGQCPCQSGASGMFCDKCADGYWNYSAAGCQKCDCESDLAMGTICDTKSGQCQCMEGATGVRCENCLPGYLVIPHRGCQVCDECVVGLVENMQQSGREFDQLEFDLQNVTISQVSSRRLNRLHSATSSLQQHVNYTKILAADQANDFGSFTIPHSKNIDEVIFKLRRFVEDGITAKVNAVDMTANAFEISRYIRLLYLRLKDSTEKLNTFSGSLRADSKSKSGKKMTGTWLKEANNFLIGIKATTMEENTQKLLLNIAETENITTAVGEFESSLTELHNHTASLTDYVSSMISTIRDLQSNLNRTRTSLEKAEMNCVEMETAPIITKMPHPNTTTVEKMLSEANENMEAAQEIINGTMGLRAELVSSMVPLNESRPMISSKLNNNKQALEKLQHLKAKATEKAEQLGVHADDLVQQFSGSTGNVSEALEASNAYRQIVEVLNSSNEILTGIQSIMDDKLLLEAVKPLLEDLKDMANASLNDVRVATGIRSNISNQVRKELSSQEETISNFWNELNATVDILKEMESNADVYEQAESRISQAKNFASDSLTAAKSGQDSFNSSAARHSAFMDMARTKISEQISAISHIKRANANMAQVSVAVPNVLGNVSSLRQAFVKSVAAINAVETGITLLREKIARARSLANMVKLGVRFYPNSTLELYKGDLLKEVEAQSDISLFFRTQHPNGLLFFIGNPESPAARKGGASSDFLAMEVVDGKAKCIFDLGAGEASVASNKIVSDGRWHKATVERVGKLLTLKVSTEGEPDDQTEIFSHGPKTILNLHKNSSRFFVGGVPASFELPKTVANRRFNGQIEGLVFHGEPTGLWNFAMDGRNNTYGAAERKELHPEATLNGIHLNGKGYVALQRLLWNPREEIDLVFYFKTYSNEGLMFYIGKERDMLAVDMKRGHVRLHLNLGSGSALLTTSRKYNDGSYHRVQVKREGKHAILSVDLVDTAEDHSPGSLNHLDVTDTFYVGGLPHGILPSTPPLSQQGFHGCIERMQVNGHNVNLNRYVEGYFIELGCPERPIRLVAFDRPGGSVKFSHLTWNAEMELTFKFRTVRPNTALLLVTDELGVNSLWIALREGSILMKSRSAGRDTDHITIDAKNFSDADWHHVSVSKIGEQLSMDVDDLYSNLTWLGNLGVYAQSENSMQLGALPVVDQSLGRVTDFVGCFSDLTFNRRILNFAMAERSGDYISYDTCPDELFLFAEDSSVQLQNLTEASNASSASDATSGYNEYTCALRRQPARHTPCGGNCYRFGVEKNSRLEYESLSSPIESKCEISLELRSNSHSGFLLFAWDQKTDYIALYLKEGKLVFEFDSGSGPAVLQSKRDILDYQWHYVKLIRSGRDGALWLDDVLEVESKSDGLSSRIELKRPFYVGGLPDDAYRLAQKQRASFQTVAAVFSGCMRNLLLNGSPLGEISNSVGVYPCDNNRERGVYYGDQPGYLFLEHKFQADKMLSLNLQIKPRINDGILFVLATPSGSEIISTQLNEGDLLVALEQDGSSPQHLRMKMKTKNLICDGHWHTIRLLKVKNFLTVGFDGSNTHTQVKKGTSAAKDEKFNLYLGGVPESFVAKGLLSKGNFLGCMRDISLEPTNGKQRKYIDFKEIPLFGSVSTEGCPLD